MSKGTMKRKIVEQMYVNKKGRSTSTKGPKRPMLEFLDSEKAGGIPNYFFPLVITATISDFDVSQILIDGGNSCDIIYSELFEKIGLNKENSRTNEGSDLKAFNNITTHPWGYIELMIIVGKGKDVRTIDS